MACAKSKPKLKPVKRNDADIWLVGHLASTLHTTKLPSKKEVSVKAIKDLKCRTPYSASYHGCSEDQV